MRKSFTEATPKKRTPRAVKAVKAYIIKHCKVEDVKIGPALNDQLWERGIRNPPARVTVDVLVDGDVAKVELEGIKYLEVKKSEKKVPETLKDKIAAKVTKKAPAAETKSDDEPQKDAPVAKATKKAAPAPVDAKAQKE